MDSNFKTMGLDLELLQCFVKLQKLKVRVSFRKSKSKMNKKNIKPVRGNSFNSYLYLLFEKIGVGDLWHFGKDLDPRIRKYFISKFFC